MGKRRRGGAEGLAEEPRSKKLQLPSETLLIVDVARAFSRHCACSCY